MLRSPVAARAAEQGRLTDAEPLYLKDVAIGEKALPANHPISPFGTATSPGSIRLRAASPKLSKRSSATVRSPASAATNNDSPADQRA